MPKASTGIRIEGLKDLRRASRRFPVELKAGLKEASNDIAARAVRDIQRAANSRAETKAARSVRVRRGREPMIAAGGGSRTEGGPMFWGTEFGGGRRRTTQQFRPWSGTQGYWFYPTVRTMGRQWAEMWLDATDDAIRRYWSNQ